MGTISDPGGIVIPPSWGQSEITQNIQTSESAYTTALVLFTTKKNQYSTDLQEMLNLTTTLETRRAILLANPGDPTAQSNYDNALNDFNAFFPTYTNSATAYESAMDNALIAAENYTTALSYQQVYTANLSNEDINTTVTSLLALPTPPSPQNTDLPEFKWIDQLQRTTMTEDISERTATLTTILTAFNSYRYLEWQIASARTVSTSAFLAFLHARFVDARDNTTASEQAKNVALAASDQADANVVTLVNQRTAVRNTLQTAITNYESEYIAADDPFTTVISAIETYTQTYSNAIAQIEAQTQQEIDAAYNAKRDEDLDEQASHFDDYPAVSGVSEDHISSAVAAAMRKFEGTLSSTFGRTLNAASIPELPPSNAKLSMNQLMKLISQIQLMIQELIRETAEADRWVDNIRLKLASQHLSMFGSVSQAADLWNQYLLDADISYNLNVEVENLANLGEFIPIYDNYRNNIDTINTVIQEINADIAEYNSSIESLVNGANIISDELIKAINAEREHVPDVPNYLDFFGEDPNVVGNAPLSEIPLITSFSIPAFEEIEESDFPELSNVEQPTQATIAQVNSAIENLLLTIAPFEDRALSALQDVLGVNASLDLETFYTREAINIRDNQDELGLFEQITVTLIGFAVQAFFIKRAKRVLKGASVNNLLREVGEIFSTPNEDTLGKTVSSPGVSLAIAMAGTNIEQSTLGKALNTVTSSESFTKSFFDILERTAIISGLQTAGTVPEALKHLSTLGIPIQEVLQEQGIDPSSIVEEESTQALNLAFAEQLARTATIEGPLKDSALSVLGQLPELSGLSKDEIDELISILVALQQLLLLLIAVLAGLQGGVSIGQLISGVFGPLENGETNLTQLFEGLGLSLSRAQELASLVAGRDELLSVLSSLGFNTNTRTILLAVIAASEGKIPLTSGVPGGAAFFDTLIAYLRDNGIVLTQNIFSSEFIKSLVAQLELKADAKQKTILRQELLQQKAEQKPTESLADRLNTIKQDLLDRLHAPPAEPTKTEPSPIQPSLLMQRFIDEFRRLPTPAQEELLAIASAPAIPPLNTEEQAALTLAIRLQQINAHDATLLLTLLAKERAGKLSGLETDLIRKLFARSEEEIRQADEDRKKEILKNEIYRPITAPATVPIQTVEVLRQSLETVSRKFSDRSFAVKTVESFARSVEKLSDFNTVALDLFLDPGRNILKQFSIISRTASDKRQQPQILFGG